MNWHAKQPNTWYNVGTLATESQARDDKGTEAMAGMSPAERAKIDAEKQPAKDARAAVGQAKQLRIYLIINFRKLPGINIKKVSTDYSCFR